MTTCWPCSSGKADFTLEELGLALLTEDEVRSAWDGLTHAYAALWKAAGGRDAVWHRPWLRALGVPERA